MRTFALRSASSAVSIAAGESATLMDGTEVEIGPGEAYVIDPGNVAWVVGDEGFVGFEFESRSAEEYAKA